ncbi:hypothetical protein QTP88_028424 [Uroleucon formosanum]
MDIGKFFKKPRLENDEIVTFNDLLLSPLRYSAYAAASSTVAGHPAESATSPTDRRGFLVAGKQKSSGSDHQAGPAFQIDE